MLMRGPNVRVRPLQIDDRCLHLGANWANGAAACVRAGSGLGYSWVRYGYVQREDPHADMKSCRKGGSVSWESQDEDGIANRNLGNWAEMMAVHDQEENLVM
ncbi:hypothetical protein K438DRAFT_1769736 [Mycena galopus ATCC 62051]|nr:hypothetical protein K438DRAFT_1769736 [Mycena galopus ATCC 62051]